MSHFDVRAEYSKRAGQALAQTYDRNLLSLAVKAARDTGAGGLGVGATGQQNAVSVQIGAAPTVQQIVDAFYTAARVMDDAFIPSADRFAIVSPTTYWALATNDKLLNRFFSENNGSYAGGDVFQVAGFKLIKSPNLAINHTTATGTFPDYNNKYAVDASKTIAMCMTSDALGTVKLLDLSTEMEWDIRRQGTLLVAKMAVG